MSRFIAIIVLFIPGLIAAFGIKWMRDALFGEFHPIFQHVGIQFMTGFIMFVLGFLFVSGFIVYRDRKKQKAKENRISK